MNRWRIDTRSRATRGGNAVATCCSAIGLSLLLASLLAAAGHAQDLDGSGAGGEAGAPAATQVSDSDPPMPDSGSPDEPKRSESAGPVETPAQAPSGEGTPKQDAQVAEPSPDGEAEEDGTESEAMQSETTEGTQEKMPEGEARPDDNQRQDDDAPPSQQPQPSDVASPEPSDVASPEPSAPASPQRSRPVLRLPPALPDGRNLRPIALFLSQMDELIPDDYRPVSIDQLRQAITRLTDQATDDNASRLKSAVYWVEVRGDSLVSNRSIIDIESDRATEVRRSLGDVNLAIEPPLGRIGESFGNALPRLESEADGTLVAVFQGDDNGGTGIEFRWKLNGQLSGTGYEFTMQLPRTPQTRIVLSAPGNVSVEVLDGVLRSRTGPPPDASEFSNGRNLRWYEIDAGGLSQVRLRTSQPDSATERGSLIVRRSSIQYELEPGGLSWTSRMVVQLPSDIPLPMLQIAGTTVTSVKINATDVPVASRAIGNQVRQLQLQLPPGLSGSESSVVNVTVTGYSSWSAELGWCDLPKPIWIGENIVYASAVDEVQIAVVDPLRVMAWQLPDDWKQIQRQRLENGITLFSADGPPIEMGVIGDRSGTRGVASADSGASGSGPDEIASADSSDPEELARSWSRVQLTSTPDLLSSDLSLRLEVGAGVLNAKARLVATVNPQRITPLRLEIEPDWSLESVTFAKSGRVVEYAGVGEQAPSLDLWPESEDAEGAQIAIEVAGSRPIANVPSGLTIPSTWFVRLAGVQHRVLAAIVPPADLNWSGEAAMERSLIAVPNPAQEPLSFFGALRPETLWFRPGTGRTPPVSLQTPSVSYNATSVLKLRWEDGDLIEQLAVSIESQSQSLKQVVVHTGPADERPDFVWSISGSEEVAAINLPSSDVMVGRGDDDGVYTIDVADTTLRGRKLIARRRYPAKNSFQLQLPSVPGAASQDSDVLIDANLMVTDRPRAVQLVPLGPSDLSELSSGGARESLVSEEATELASSRGWTRLRYDAVEQPSIRLLTVDNNPDVTIVWREQVKIIASSRGTDRIEANYTVFPAAPFRIDSDPELQLVSVLRDGVPVDTKTLQSRPIVLEPRFKAEQIQVTWDRSQFGSGWIRQCRIPKLQVSGTVMRSEYALDSASDTFAPAALLAGNAGGNRAIMIRPGDSLILLRRNTALAVGWLIAILVFAGGWYIAERTTVAVAAMLVLVTTVLFLWWPWRLAVIGWLVVPLVSAALLSTAKAWRRRSGSNDPATVNDGGSQSAVRVKGSSTNFSVTTMARVSILLLVMVSADVRPCWSQEAVVGQEKAGRTAVNVLAPVRQTGELSGEMVYIPRTVFNELFRTGSNNVPQDARFQTANYRVRINPAINVGDQLIFTSVEAEYLIRIANGDQNVNLVRLPLASTAVRRLEAIDEITRIIPFEVDTMGQVIASLPRGNSFRIRATLRPMVSESEQWTRMNLSIPPVASSRLIVESEQNLDAIRVGGPRGRLLQEETELLRRWVEDIGPTRSLQIDVRVGPEGAAAASRALGRRYWVHAGKRQVTIDCEVDPPNTVAAGETFQFVVRDSAMPSVVTPSWRFRGSELYSPTRRLITLESTRDTPGPIRLLWTQPVQWAQESNAPAVPIRIPEVIAAALGENSDAWIALHCDSSLQYAPLTRENIEPLSVDQFLAAWTGYRGRIDRALVPIGEMPTPLLQLRSASRARVVQSHHLHVLPDRLELYYQGTLTPSDFDREIYRLRVPSSLDLLRVTVNGKDRNDQPLKADGFEEVLLGDFSGTEPVEIEVVALQELKPKTPFSPPRLAILPDALTVDQYRMSRDRSTTVTVRQPPRVEPVAAAELATADSLAKGWIPVSNWSLQSEQSPLVNEFPGGLYQVQSQPTRFDCDQLIALNRQGPAWSMETLVRFGRRIPDFIDVEVPAAWCESLEVTPVTALSRQQAIDPTRQVIRIRCDRDTMVAGTLSIRGQLASSETGRVSVPSVRVLGFGQRRVHISVPTQLDNETIQWRTSAVEGDELPEHWSPAMKSARRSTYVAANPSWSIDLAPLPEVDAKATALSFDTQLFPQEDGVLVLCHWDLFPGSLESVEVQLPPGAQCMGAWSAGKAVVPRVAGQHAASMQDPATQGTAMQDPMAQDPVTLNLPLALSRLSQPIEVLVRVPAEAARQADYLPELIGVPVQQEWLASYVPADQRQSRWGEAGQLDDDRALSLASAVADAIDAVEFINQRPREEVVTWLRLWFARYQMIAEAAGHRTFLDEGQRPAEEEDAETASATAAAVRDRLTLPRHLQWEALDARMASYAERFLEDLPAPAGQPVDQDAFLFGVADYEGFLQNRVSKPSATDPPEPMMPELHGDQGLRSFIINLLTLLLVAGLILCVRPVQRVLVPVVRHPAFWLGILGVFGFAVAPVPVAAALLLVAIALPVFPSRRRPTSPSVR